jgi:hypothetical protein
MHRGSYPGRGRSWCAFVLEDGTHNFPVKMRGGRVGKTPPKRLWLKDRKSQAVLLKQTRPKSIVSFCSSCFEVSRVFVLSEGVAVRYALTVVRGVGSAPCAVTLRGGITVSTGGAKSAPLRLQVARQGTKH